MHMITSCCKNAIIPLSVSVSLSILKSPVNFSYQVFKLTGHHFFCTGFTIKSFCDWADCLTFLLTFPSKYTKPPQNVNILSSRAHKHINSGLLQQYLSLTYPKSHLIHVVCNKFYAHLLCINATTMLLTIDIHIGIIIKYIQWVRGNYLPCLRGKYISATSLAADYMLSTF